MLFNSFQFVFIYLPLVLFGFFRLAKLSHYLAATWLATASLFFYGYWNPSYVILLVTSISGNYYFGRLISWADNSKKQRKFLLTVAVALNLIVLGYYKYTNFFISSLNDITGAGIAVDTIILPLGISFFTFTQIAFLVDTYYGKVREYNFIHYVLFVTYFPHLLAGPVLHHREMMPQFALSSTYRFNHENMAVGMMIFSMGLFKKTVLADGVAVNVAPIFNAAAGGSILSFSDAWIGAISYALQIYFDFSGYSDMAIGLSRMFGIVLPLNFHSPYKSVNIIEFWRRWHMTLSRFLRDYLYIPLGGNRLGRIRRYYNLMITMLLGGLWHGAGWTFIFWGGLHGLFLVGNHFWRYVRSRFGQDPRQHLSKPMHVLSVSVTFLLVTIAWVFFRSAGMHQAFSIVGSMLGLNGFVIKSGIGFASSNARNFMFIALLLIWAAPNTQQIMRFYCPALDMPKEISPSIFAWRLNAKWAIINAFTALLALMSISKLSEFIYFQF